MTKLILYSKPGCHLCEGLQEKLEQIQTLDFELEIRDITTRQEWFQAYQYEIPVLVLEERRAKKEEGIHPEAATVSPQNSIFTPLPRLSPRASVPQVEQMLQKFGLKNKSE
ncbi:MAG: glutaredoxin family protein [Oculatellaceae cyanobacterium bins.114]|nr:glutaredoxin family protein [Oculatellaceae cyanobacterium bins.114]